MNDVCLSISHYNNVRHSMCEENRAVKCRYISCSKMSLAQRRYFEYNKGYIIRTLIKSDPFGPLYGRFEFTVHCKFKRSVWGSIRVRRQGWKAPICVPIWYVIRTLCKEGPYCGPCWGSKRVRIKGSERVRNEGPKAPICVPIWSVISTGSVFSTGSVNKYGSV